MQSNSKFIIYGGGTSRHETEILNVLVSLV